MLCHRVLPIDKKVQMSCCVIANYPHFAGSDFNTTIIERVLEPSASRVEELIPFTVPLLSDAALETEEVFLIFLKVLSTEVVTIDRRCALARLQGVSANQEGRHPRILITLLLLLSRSNSKINIHV